VAPAPCAPAVDARPAASLPRSGRASAAPALPAVRRFIRACAFGVALSASFALPTAAAQEVAVVHYDVAGATVEELHASLGQRGPWVDGTRFHAHTKWNVTWTYRYAPGVRGCGFSRFDVRIDAEMTLPRWQGRTGAPTALVERWDRYLAALRAHEYGHYAHGLEAAREIEALGSGFQVGSCARIETDFNARAMEIIAKFNQRDLAYDRDSGHGRSQGASW
jgi:predicted secreted Zn-dependent protease